MCLTRHMEKSSINEITYFILRQSFRHFNPMQTKSESLILSPPGKHIPKSQTRRFIYLYTIFFFSFLARSQELSSGLELRHLYGNTR